MCEAYIKSTGSQMNQVKPIMENKSIAVIGLGYVGLPLFCQLSTSFSIVGYDLDNNRVNEISRGIDSKNSIDRKLLCSALSNSIVTADISELSSSNIFIVTVPTPITKNNKPDTRALEDVCLSISKIISKNSIVIFESTVYPGATEELCVPLLAKSGLRFNVDFFVGYSPERINVGDTEHQIKNISKIISGSTPETTQLIASIYQQVLSKDIVVASCIKVAEAAKMYENVQRDLLIALANEYSEYCKMENISIDEVTMCASSKWNFSNVRPGLVGGHCIGVDPYYLLDRASSKGIKLPLIQNARGINENKSINVANRIYNSICDLKLSSPKILLLGFAYKPNSCDIRNTKVSVVFNELRSKGYYADCFDPLVNIDEVHKEYGLSLLSSLSEIQSYDLIIVMVEHDSILQLIQSCNESHIIYLRNLL